MLIPHHVVSRVVIVGHRVDRLCRGVRCLYAREVPHTRSEAGGWCRDTSVSFVEQEPGQIPAYAR